MLTPHLAEYCAIRSGATREHDCTPLLVRLTGSCKNRIGSILSDVDRHQSRPTIGARQRPHNLEGGQLFDADPGQQFAAV